jgi:uncharacterized protein (DUF1684 family)
MAALEATAALWDWRRRVAAMFAYNPSGFYSPRWVCPLSPRTNRLPSQVRGGEKGHLS